MPYPSRANLSKKIRNYAALYLHQQEINKLYSLEACSAACGKLLISLNVGVCILLLGRHCCLPAFQYTPITPPAWLSLCVRLCCGSDEAAIVAPPQRPMCDLMPSINPSSKMDYTAPRTVCPTLCDESPW